MEKPARQLELKVVPIGNSRGVRLPKAVLDKYAIRDTVLIEERKDGLLLRSKEDRRLSWENTFRETAREREDWRDLGATLADGLNSKQQVMSQEISATVSTSLNIDPTRGSRNIAK